MPGVFVITSCRINRATSEVTMAAEPDFFRMPTQKGHRERTVQDAMLTAAAGIQTERSDA